MAQHPTIRATRGFSSFFMPSSELAGFLLSASVGRARHSGLPNSRRIANTIACLSRAALRDKKALDRVREDVSLRLWRYLGTLSRRAAAMRGKEGSQRFELGGPQGVIACDLLIQSDELADGLQERLGLDSEERELSDNLVIEFMHWLNLNGCYDAPWGTIVAVDEDRIGLRAEADEQQTREPDRERVEVTANYGMSEEDIIKQLSEAKKASPIVGKMKFVGKTPAGRDKILLLERKGSERKDEEAVPDVVRDEG